MRDLMRERESSALPGTIRSQFDNGTAMFEEEATILFETSQSNRCPSSRSDPSEVYRWGRRGRENELLCNVACQPLIHASAIA